MKIFIRLASYFFHPLWMPLLASVLYFWITPKFYSPSLVKAKLLALIILTVFIPLVFLFILKTSGIVQSMSLKNAKERRLPLLFFCVIATLVLNYVLGDFHFIELYYFFTGILFSGLTCFILSVFKVKVSLHVLGISGLSMFMIALSIFFQSNVLPLIGFLLFAIGWTASSRLQAKAHSSLELIFGLFIGVLPQLILVQYWL